MMKKDPQRELHTNFRLNASEGYLALVMPDGLTIASEFSNYPEQFEDVSFGEGYGEPQNISLLQEGSQAKWKVPDSTITNWNSDSFDDSDCVSNFSFKFVMGFSFFIDIVIAF